MVLLVFKELVTLQLRCGSQYIHNKFN